MADDSTGSIEQVSGIVPSRGNGARGDVTGREIYLRVAEAFPFDIHRGIARMDQEAFDALGIHPGALIHVAGKRRTTVRVELAPDMPGPNLVRLDGTLRDNAQVSIDERVKVRAGGALDAHSITLSAPDAAALSDEELLATRMYLSGRVLTPGDRVAVTILARGDRMFQVVETEPTGPVAVRLETIIRTRVPPAQRAKVGPSNVRYEDIGGLDRELTRVRELIELPMKYPQLFSRLRIEPPRGVLLYGPPGTGKTLIARAVATEVQATFIHVNGPEIMQKYVGESEGRLREVFEQAQREAPAIIFLDEIDAIAPKRANVVGDVEKRVVAQLLTLMDGLVSRGQVTVIGATNMPDLVDPALRRPGRFDREIAVNAPSPTGRLQILRIHSRGFPMDEDVDLERLAEITHGFTGADLEVLCKEAGMLALRDLLDKAGLDTVDIDALSHSARIHAHHFYSALKMIEPTATREVLVEKPNVPWENVGGLDEARGVLENSIELPRQRPDLFAQAGIRPPRGILLTGPSGTGKSLLVRAIATSTGLSLITADAATLLSKWLGESEKSVRHVFARARQAAPCLLFFDDLDSIAPMRGGDQAGGAVDRVVSQLLTELDTLDELSEVIVLGATNRPDLVDPALLSPRRFAYVVELALPNETARREILAAHTRKMPLADDVNLEALAALSDGFSGADLAAVCQRAALAEIRCLIALDGQSGHTSSSANGTAFHSVLKVGQAAFEEALADIRHTIEARSRRGRPSVAADGPASGPVARPV
ncbi:MAG: CDC48 family AAA ATPase [Chloroflexi bacterium]|nr:CDC48 family AAA ATPase [Chloroflexota bacterium]